MILRLLKKLMIVYLFLFSLVSTAGAQEVKVHLGNNAAQQQAQVYLGEEIRHRLITQSFYDVFDWLEGEMNADGTLVLRGQVTRPTLKASAERSVSDLTGVKRIVNEIEVLPVSPQDDRLRQRLYRAIYNFNSPLYRYAVRAVPPIHIIVDRGRVTLKGTVATRMESQLAETYARQVPGTFEVRNELRVETDNRQM